MTKLSIDWQDFADKVSLALNNASQLSVLPVAGDRWEELLVAIFRRMGYDVDWTPGSHAPGADIKLSKTGFKSVSISVKAGSLSLLQKTTPALKLSSYRLTRYKSIEDKIAFIDEDAAIVDWYLFAVRNDTLIKKQHINRRYSVYLTRATILTASNAEWVETKGGWAGVQENGVHMAIIHNMSDQLWIDIPISLISGSPDELTAAKLGALIATVTIPKENLGSRIELLFESIIHPDPPSIMEV